MDFEVTDDLIRQELEKCRKLLADKMSDMLEEGIDPTCLVPTVEAVRHVLRTRQLDGGPVSRVQAAITIALMPSYDGVDVDVTDSQ